MGRLGGNRSPRLPEVVNNPSEKFSGYFSFRRAGYNSPPSAIIVTPEAPVKAVKKAHVQSDTIDRLPGSHPKIALEKLTSLSDVLLSARIYPAKVKRGIVYNSGWLEKLL